MITDLKIRQMIEEREESLSPFAARSRCSKGRAVPEEPCPLRTCFQRDRDRIIHCNSFRRLKHKTQVFISPQGDHYVTRLTHTLEVAQIARTISRSLRLNEDLTEAIALGHDLGHTPFGHIGEEVLNQLCPGGFRHNEQSLRVVDILENGGKGLNLTAEVREGILNHSKSTSVMLQGWGEIGTIEAEVVRISDAVAYVNHDLDDALRAGVISQNDLPSLVGAVLGNSRSERINRMVCDIVEQSWQGLSKDHGTRPRITMSSDVTGATEVLRRFLFDHVYHVQAVRRKAQNARSVLLRLHEHFSVHPEALPAEAPGQGSSIERRTVDFIAGMTDQFATRLARNLKK